MMATSTRHTFLIGLAALVASACSGASLSGGAFSGHGKSKKSDDSPAADDEGADDRNDDEESEIILADEPTDVAGAFLADCQEAPGEVEPVEGAVTYGCAVRHKANDARYEGEVKDASLLVRYSDAEEDEQVQLSQASVISTWHLIFSLPRARLAQPASFQLRVTLGGEAVALTGTLAPPSSNCVRTTRSFGFEVAADGRSETAGLLTDVSQWKALGLTISHPTSRPAKLIVIEYGTAKPWAFFCGTCQPAQVHNTLRDGPRGKYFLSDEDAPAEPLLQPFHLEFAGAVRRVTGHIIDVDGDEDYSFKALDAEGALLSETNVNTGGQQQKYDGRMVPWTLASPVGRGSIAKIEIAGKVTKVDEKTNIGWALDDLEWEIGCPDSP